jgi:hypothetical protein
MSGASPLNTGVPAIARDQHTPLVTLTRAVVAHRDLLSGLLEIALDQLARSTDRPLKRPQRQEPRADLAR